MCNEIFLWLLFSYLKNLNTNLRSLAAPRQAADGFGPWTVIWQPWLRPIKNKYAWIFFPLTFMRMDHTVHVVLCLDFLTLRWILEITLHRCIEHFLIFALVSHYILFHGDIVTVSLASHLLMGIQVISFYYYKQCFNESSCTYMCVGIWGFIEIYFTDHTIHPF